MYKKIQPAKTQLHVNKAYEGETIEEKIQRIVNNKEPIKDAADIIYTDRAQGVMPDYDIRTDRWEVAIDAMDKVAKTYAAKRAERIKARTETKDSATTETKEVSGNPSQQTNDPK